MKRAMLHRPGMLAVPALLFVVVVFALPFAAVARVATAGAPVSGSGRFYDLALFEPSRLSALAADPLFLSVVGVTVRLGAIVTLVCMVLAVPFAIAIHRTRGWRRGALVAAVVAPKLVNLLVLLYGILLLLGNDGFINQVLLATGIVDEPLRLFGNLFAVVFTEVIIVLPYPILVLAAGFLAADPRHEEAARSLGAGPVRAYLEAVIRPATPAVISAILITAVWGVGAFVGPLVLGNPPYYTLAVEVYTRTLERLAWVEAAGWALLGVVAVGAALALVSAATRPLRRTT